MPLFEFARRDGGARDQIARDFIAKADSTVQGVLRWWEIMNHLDCWILHRAFSTAPVVPFYSALDSFVYPIMENPPGLQ